MWKFVFVLLVTALALLVAQLIADAPVIQTRVGASRSYSNHLRLCRGEGVIVLSSPGLTGRSTALSGIIGCLPSRA